MHDARDILIALAIKHKGNWNSIYRDASRNEIPEEYYFEQVRNMSCQAVTMIDPHYPHFLKAVFKAPFVLFYYGDLSIISDYQHNISVVGSRLNSEYGERITKEIVSGLAEKGYSIISGMAIGIDTIAHWACINAGSKTCAILGCGIDFCYPSSNEDLYKLLKQNHLVISEYPGTTAPSPEYFPIRNRLIAGLSKTLVLTEAGYKSGSLITASLALRGNSDVMCVPTQAGNESACNRLIMCGAYLVESAEDVLNQMQPF